MSPPPHSTALFLQLVLAASAGRLDEVRQILSTHPLLARAGVDQDTPLIAAAWFGHADCVAALLPHSDVHANDPNKQGLNALMATALMGRTACMQLLLPHCDANARSRSGLTALMLAAGQNRLDCLTLLLPRCDPRAVDDEGKSAFDYALRDRQWACVDRLAVYAPRPAVHEALKRVREAPHALALLPHCIALCEHEALEQSLATPPGNPDAVPDPHPRYRRV